MKQHMTILSIALLCVCASAQAMEFLPIHKSRHTPAFFQNNNNKPKIQRKKYTQGKTTAIITDLPDGTKDYAVIVNDGNYLYIKGFGAKQIAERLLAQYNEEKNSPLFDEMDEKTAYENGIVIKITES